MKDDKINKLSRTDKEVDELLLDAMIIAGCHENIKNENIKERDDISFPSEFDEDMQKVFQRFKDEERFLKRRRNISKLKAVANKIAVSFAILALISILSITTTEAGRTRFLNVYVRVFDVKTDFVFTSENQVTEGLDLESQLERFGYIPDGFSIVSTFDDESIVKVSFENTSGEYISIRVTGDGVMSIDTEDADVSEEIIGDHECFVVEKDGVVRVIFLTEDGKVVTFSSNLEKSTIKKIIRNFE